MMPDREKAINCLTDIEQIMVCRQEICPREELQYWIELKEGVADALALLKEQEAVEPILIREGRNKNYNDYVCPRCDNDVVYEQNYCLECGVQFLWKGR